MAASFGQVTVPTIAGGTVAAWLCDVPPGAVAILSSTQTSADVYLGPGTATTSSNGAPLDTNGPTTISNPPTATKFSIYGCAGTGSHVVGVIVITPR